MYQADYTAIISPFLPAGAYMLEITEPAMRKAVLAADFDGDHALEVAAAYRFQNDDYVLILKHGAQGWFPAGHFQGKSRYFMDFYKEEARFVAAEAVGDVTGDGIQDTVFLTASQTPDSPFLQNITLQIRNGATGQVEKIPLKENAGYDPTVFLGDFAGDKKDDILVIINTGGSGGLIYAYIYTYEKGQYKLIFDDESFNKSNTYTVTYLDQFKARVTSANPPKKYLLDLQYKGKEYLSEIYNSDGTLKEPVEGWVAPLSGLYPVDFERDGIFELDTYQNIAGRYSADGLGYMMNVLKWDGTSFKTDRQSIAVFGEET
ncbi:VCBS repeat-containing protein [Metabacillus indicus]|uniref:VCBS repeat-containing protein n=1 Tax=Metabacillus indicus TaxID=246786 RepID=UPI000A8109B2|nr:VCBS repeat-containing protein [Metabacillus indicus]